MMTTTNFQPKDGKPAANCHIIIRALNITPLLLYLTINSINSIINLRPPNFRNCLFALGGRLFLYFIPAIRAKDISFI